jgi:phosphoribosylformylglycinamidine cyclo-ligase
VNITGHGWRKLMRAESPFTYVIETLPRALPIFDFIQKHGLVDDAEAYGNLNMGAGFALYMPEADVDKALEVVKSAGPSMPFAAFRAGHIESGEKKVVIRPKALEFHGSTLAVR